jgi:hypothetical protein
VLGVIAIIDFLNGREKAVVIWAVAVLVSALFKSDGLGRSFLGVLRALVQPKLLLLFGSAALYCAGLVLLARTGGLWHANAIKETVYWFVGTGLVLTGNATQASPRDPGYFPRLLRQAVRLTLIVEFLIALYVFPFGVELLLVPLIALFVGMQVVAAGEPEMAPAKKLIDGVLIAIGIALMVYVVLSAITDLKSLLTREHGEDLLLAPALTLAFVPFLALVAWFSKRELDHLRKRHRAALV